MTTQLKNIIVILSRKFESSKMLLDNAYLASLLFFSNALFDILDHTSINTGIRYGSLLGIAVGEVPVSQVTAGQVIAGQDRKDHNAPDLDATGQRLTEPETTKQDMTDQKVAVSNTPVSDPAIPETAVPETSTPEPAVPEMVVSEKADPKPADQQSVAQESVTQEAADQASKQQNSVAQKSTDLIMTQQEIDDQILPAPLYPVSIRDQRIAKRRHRSVVLADAADPVLEWHWGCCKCSEYNISSIQYSESYKVHKRGQGRILCRRCREGVCGRCERSVGMRGWMERGTLRAKVRKLWYWITFS